MNIGEDLQGATLDLEAIIRAIVSATVDACAHAEGFANGWHDWDFGGSLDKVRADALERLRTEQPGWRTIEDGAPKDGARILAWCEANFPSPFQGPALIYWTDHNGGGWVGHYFGNPTHWMPLPPAPEAR